MGPGSGPFSLTGQANSMGARVCASTDTWPGHREFEDPDARAAVAETWGVPTGRLPDDPGPGVVRIVDAIARGDVDVCWTVATNPVVGLPDANHVADVLDDAFLVVQDAFRSETVELADVVLPAATWGDSSGTVMNMERSVSRVTAATDPVETVRRDLDIVAAIGSRIDGDLFDPPPVDPEAVFDEIRALTAGTSADISGIDYDRLDEELAVRWPAPDAESAGGYRYVDGEGWWFPTDSGLARFSTATHRGVPEPVDGDYPLVLTTGRGAEGYNTGVRSGTGGPPSVRVHPETVVTHIEALSRGRTVVESRRGSVPVDVRPDDGVPPGVVWMEIHSPDANRLTLPAVDPESDQPNYKGCAVRLRPPEPSRPVSCSCVTRTRRR